MKFLSSRFYAFTKILIIAIPLLSTAFLFQNCSSGFQSAAMGSSSAASVVSCTTGGVSYSVGQTVTSYSASADTYPSLCTSVTRTCLSSGLFDGPIVNSCVQSCVFPGDGVAVVAGNTNYYTAASGATCTPTPVICEQSTGLFNVTLPATAVSSCTVTGQTCPYTNGTGVVVPTGYSAGSTVTGYKASADTYPNLCASVTSTCEVSGMWNNGAPLYTACVQSCSLNGAAVAQGTYHTVSVGTAAQCATTTTCGTNGQFNPAVSGTQVYSQCTAIAAPVISSLTATPTTVTSGQTATLNWAVSSASGYPVTVTLNGVTTTGTSFITSALTATTTYTLVATNTVNGTNQSTTAAVTVTVTPATNPTPTPTPTPTGTFASSCTATSGTLHLSATVPRAKGISPLLVFFDATATTDSAIADNMTPFQDVTYTWSFGDAGASGTGTWAYGSNPGKNSMNSATGGVGAHLYIVPSGGSDTSYVTTVTATDGTYTASCQLGVTAYDPSGANGFSGTATTCVYSDGSLGSGCPAGAATLSSSSFATALSTTYLGNGKQVLFKCGDTFSGKDTTINATKWSVGAYGGCQGTQTNRPIINSSLTSNSAILVGYTAGDGRIADLDFEGAGTGASAVNTDGGTTQINYQITLWNLNSNGNASSYAYSQGAQWGMIGLVQKSSTGIGTFLNYNENNPGTWSSSNVFNNLNYAALIGSSISGVGSAGDNGSGIETVRISACRMCVLENNSIQNSNNVGSNLKLHGGNTNQSCGGATGGPCFPCTVGGNFATTTCWTGVYTELIEISDNYFGGYGGAGPEVAPQNAGDDERLRNIVFERNLVTNTTEAEGGRQAYFSGQNMTIRDNVFLMSGTSSIYPFVAAQMMNRGDGIFPAWQSLYYEVYNNTCYNNTSPYQGGQECIGFDTAGGYTPATSSIIKNNMYYTPGKSTSLVVNNTAGSTNVISNNTSNSSSNPAFINGSGAFSLISDFKPTANYSGGTSVPVIYDALGVLWSPTWDLGAVHP
jgi:hypothetical protein